MFPKSESTVFFWSHVLEGQRPPNIRWSGPLLLLGLVQNKIVFLQFKFQILKLFKYNILETENVFTFQIYNCCNNLIKNTTYNPNNPT